MNLAANAGREKLICTRPKAKIGLDNPAGQVAFTLIAKQPFVAILPALKLPQINQPVSLLIKGKEHLVTCVDVFDGGFGYYFDAVFPKKTRHKFSTGEQCAVPELGPKCLADFVSYPKQDSWTVRFLLPKWG